jgi:DNA-binding MarR family transcriptional regulator
MLDRLEQDGYIRRLPDKGDRRRVLVELTPRPRKLATELYGSFEAAAARLVRSRPDQLTLLRDVLDGGRRFYEQQAAQLRATKKRPERAN